MQTVKTPPQIYPVGVSPRQRFELVNLFGSEELTIKGAEERHAMSRFMAALGLDRIIETASNNSGQLNSTLASTFKQSLFNLTLENVNFLLNVVLERVALNPIKQRSLMSLVVVLEEMREGRREPTPPTDLQPYEEEDWTPIKVSAIGSV